ncbi:hypothetical protein FA13DRAFT_163159 [Coprinellus micaceus]|uniref:Uncharacterized protein n=1 Tax=Coprinellus micaceus TaxID=71717 RepID=A0A4Y7TJ93_COPMI|nr:hypothetical protein FA13DRAFT_163159 [Coprinellus micaceus]
MSMNTAPTPTLSCPCVSCNTTYLGTFSCLTRRVCNLSALARRTTAATFLRSSDRTQAPVPSNLRDASYEVQVPTYTSCPSQVGLTSDMHISPVYERDPSLRSKSNSSPFAGGC